MEKPFSSSALHMGHGSVHLAHSAYELGLEWKLAESIQNARCLPPVSTYFPPSRSITHSSLLTLRAWGQGAVLHMAENQKTDCRCSRFHTSSARPTCDQQMSRVITPAIRCIDSVIEVNQAESPPFPRSPPERSASAPRSRWDDTWSASVWAHP